MRNLSPRLNRCRSGLCAVMVLVVGLFASVACSPTTAEPVRPPGIAEAVDQCSESCQRCHATEYSAWAGTDHARANRVISEQDRPAFDRTEPIDVGGSRFDLAWKDGRPRMVEHRANDAAIAHTPEFALGARPFWQPVVPAPGGRWQPTDAAYDPVHQDWFNIFGDEHRQPGEWGHWTGRGMNWNSMCAPCHMTGFRKHYELASDSYRSTWVEHGVGCIQCHGPVSQEHRNLPAGTRAPDTEEPCGAFAAKRVRAMETCAPCHARNESLTPEFRPGEAYLDHYRPTLPVDPLDFYPDGQQRGEVFDWTSFLLSRMGGHGGVTCLDCHDAHTGKTILPVENNLLCLRCHVSPGLNGAPAIDPAAHSHHAAGSAGSQCVACHMPTTTYMQRAPRHDHGFTKPDPLLTKELGIPNACNRCHTSQDTDWAIAHAEAWYGAKLDSSQRARTRVVAAARRRDPAAVGGLVTQLRREDIAAWRATLLDLSAPFVAGSLELTEIAQHSLGAQSPLERASAVRLLGAQPELADRIRPLLKDPVRLVRINAEWALSPSLPPASAERAELDAYLGLELDQPSGQARLAQDLANRGRFDAAERTLRRAADWDPHSPALPDALGFVLSAQGRPAESAAALRRAAELHRSDSQSAFRAALEYAEAGHPAEAESSLRLALQRDPAFARAWYNLGLLLAQSNRLAEASAALRRAESLEPSNPDYPYALATVLLRTGDRQGAVEAARRTLQLNPNHDGARAIAE
ncbi:MAG: ammonia-forming cytochrome c nitrite reductase subunit c552 [Verrucomicrobia bacterium]|nr:ammonia-forming cytochrome c nitrite reductase subunit c552 [Verrucomicrobiota bacterium]